MQLTPMCRSSLLMSLSLLTQLIAGFWIGSSVALVCLLGLGMLTLGITLMFGCASSLLLVWVSLGFAMVASLRVVL